MIYLLATRRGSHTFEDYLQDWTGELRLMFELRRYEDFIQWPADFPGTYIFSDIERLTDAQHAIVCDYAEQLQREHPAALLLNNPLHALRRRGLLEVLHQAGINRFRAFPLLALPQDLRYPVFLRAEREHEGPASRLIDDIEALKREALKLAVAGFRLDQMLAVEYCETKAPDGYYRKYSAFRFGERIIPAHIIFSLHWVAKDGAANELQLEEEAGYMRDHPHAVWLREVFDRAHIRYGRIDYSMLDGRPQVWEINTNPILLKTRAEYEKTAPLELPVKERLAKVMLDCFSALNVDTTMPGTAAPRTIGIRRFAAMIAPRRR